MARSRFRKLDAEKREALLAAAGEEFAEKGFEGASLNRVIEAAGFSKGSLYYYFEDKEDLYRTVAEEAMGRVLEAVGGYPDPVELTAADYWERLREFFLRAGMVLQRRDWWVKLLWAFRRLSVERGAGAAAFEPALLQAREWTAAYLARGQELGAVRKDLPLELLVRVAMAVDEASDRWLLEHRDVYTAGQMEEYVEAAVDLLHDMLDARNEGWER